MTSPPRASTTPSSDAARLIVLSGLPASGKSTLGRAVAEALALPLLDKDAFLEALFERRGVGDAAWRRRLSRAADRALIARARAARAAVIATWWRHPDSPVDSGTPTGWLREWPGEVIEVHCVCDPGVAVARFTGRARHAGHLDGRHAPTALLERFAAQAALGPLRIGRLIEWRTQGRRGVDALVATLAGARLSAP